MIENIVNKDEIVKPIVTEAEYRDYCDWLVKLPVDILGEIVASCYLATITDEDQRKNIGDLIADKDYELILYAYKCNHFNACELINMLES